MNYISKDLYIEGSNKKLEDLSDMKAQVWTQVLLGYKYKLNDKFIIYTGTVVAPFSNGLVDFDISALNLKEKPSSVQLTMNSNLYGIRYNYDNSSATSLRIELFNNGQIQKYNGNVRFSMTVYGETN